MDGKEHAPAHANHPRSPDGDSAPRRSSQRRTRIAGSKNLKQHEWALVHQHLVRRNRENKDTNFVIHGIKQDWHNVHRRCLRAISGQIESLRGMYMMAPDLTCQP